MADSASVDVSSPDDRANAGRLMTRIDQWSRIKLLVQAALDRRPQDRATFLDEACGGDQVLRAEVDSLLAAHEAAGDFAERPAIQALPVLASSDESDIHDTHSPVIHPGQQLGPYQIEE